MNSKDQEDTVDIALDGHELNDEEEECFASGIEFESEEFHSTYFDSTDDEEDSDIDNLSGGTAPLEGDCPAPSPISPEQQADRTQPAVIRKAKRIEGTGYNQPATLSSLPPASIPFEGIRKETACNNMITGHIESRERREKAELRVLDASQQNAFRQQLALRTMTDVPRELEIQTYFPLDALPSNMAQLIWAASESLQVPTEAVGSTLIGAIAIAGRGNYQIEVRPGYIEAFTLFMMIGLDSGGRKSAIANFFRRIFNEVEQQRQIEFNLDATENSLKRDIYKSIKKMVKKEYLKELLPSTALGYDDVAAIIAEKIKPIQEGIDTVDWRPRLLIDSPTYKELAAVMQTQGEAIGILEAEGGIWKNRVHANTDDIFLKGYTMEPFSDETSTTKSVVMDAPCLAICSLVQMDVVETLYSQDKLKNHGVLPRILPTFAKWRGGPKRAGLLPINADSVARYEGKIRSLLNIVRPASRTGERTWHTLHLSPEAQALLQSFEQKVNWDIHQGRFANFESFGEKLVGHAVRLAGCAHLWEHDVPHEQPIGPAAMNAGVELARFYTQHAMAAFDLERLQAIKFAHKILKWLRREPKQFFSRREAQRALGRCQAPEVQAGIDELERCGILGQYMTTTHSLQCITNPNLNPHGL